MTSASAWRVGLLPSPQYTSWDAMHHVAIEMDRLRYDSLWCSDHLYAPYPWVTGPAFEAYTVLSAWAAVTSHVRLGAMVSAVGFRNPAMLVKMITTLDHVSDGRAILGLGAGWFDTEHRAFGFEFGDPGERVSRLDEALSIIRGMLDGDAPSGSKFYSHDEVQNLPPPVQNRLPVLLGARGDRMLGLVARYADAWNLAGPYDDVVDKDQRLRQACDAVGRDHTTIERTHHGGPVFIRDTPEEAQAVCDRAFDHHGIQGIRPDLVGPPELIAERLAPFVALGFRHMYFDLISPYDDETLERLAREVRPLVEAAAVSTTSALTDGIDTRAAAPTTASPATSTSTATGTAGRHKQEPTMATTEDATTEDIAIANLVRNPSFDEPVDDADDPPTEWSISVGEGGEDRWALDTETTSDSARSLRLEPRQHCVVYQTLCGPIDDLDGKTVRFSVDVRQDRLAGQAIIQVIAFNSDAPEDPVLRTGVAGWKQIVVPTGRDGRFRSVTGKFVASGGATSVQLTLTASGTSGTVWFDNAKVWIEG